MTGDGVFFTLHEALQEAILGGLGWRSLRPVQQQAIEAVRAGANTVILAPTAGGKTEAALLPVLDLVLRGRYPRLSTIYICPLRALLNNLEPRIRNLFGLVGLSAFKWHGDVDAGRKRRFRLEPSELLMTTPESLEAMLISPNVDAASLFGDLRFFVIDEVHAFAGDDRGAHLLSVLERLLARSPHDVQRVALSATVGNPDVLGKWITGSSSRPARVVCPEKVPSSKAIRIVSVPPEGGFASPAGAEAAGRKALMFVESRRLAEEAASGLREQVPVVFVHHSSVSRDARAAAERAFSEADTAAIVATSTLELGIDVGDLDLVQQLRAPRTVSSFLQRLGRTGRRGGPARMTFYTDDSFHLIQAIALVRLAMAGWVEPIEPTQRSWHVLVHQLLTNVLERPGVLATELWEVIRRAWPFAGISGEEYLTLVRHLAATDILHAVGGTLSLGTEGERRFSRRNYFDLFAVFEGSRDVAVKTESGDDIGTLQTSFVMTQAAEEFVFVLGGRRWQAVEINLEAAVIWAKPAPKGKLPRWVGLDQGFVGRKIIEEHRRILADSELYSFVTEPAKAELRTIRGTWSEIVAVDGWPVVPTDKGVGIFTFAGGRINFTLARALAARLGCDATASNYDVTLRGATVPMPGQVINEVRRLGDAGIDEDLRHAVVRALPRRPLSKFQPLLPPPLEEEFLATRLLDFDGARGAMCGRLLPIALPMEPTP